MTCSKCGCFIPARFEHCLACGRHKSLTTKGYDIIKFEIWDIEYECRITMMRENKDGSVSFNMKTT